MFSVPSGNFGNVTAGLIACALGLPVRRMIAATNANDTVPRFLANGQWDPNPTVATMTNAMDISQPNNFPRVLALGERHGVDLKQLLRSVSLDDAQTEQSMSALHAAGYVADPHSALGWQALAGQLEEGETGVFLCTAHPAKFREEVERVLGIAVELPESLAQVADRPVLSQNLPPDMEALRPLLLEAAL